MLEMCPNSKGNHIAFTSRCVRKRNAAKPALQSREAGTAGRVPTSEATHMAMGTNRVVLGPTPSGGAAAEGGREEEEMADVEQEKAAGQPRDVIMTEKDTATDNATIATTQTEAVALTCNDCSDPAQLREVIRVDHCGTGDGSRTQGGRCVLATATERERRYWDKKFSIQNKKKQRSVDRDTERVWPGG